MNREGRSTPKRARPDVPGSPPPSRASASTRRSSARRFKLWTLLATLGILVAVDFAAGFLLIPQRQSSFRRWHPYYHHGLRPDQDRETEWGPRTYRMRTNSLGFRDATTRDVSLEQSTEGGARVLLLGDSYVEGVGIDYEQTVAGVLQETWTTRNTEVLNAAVLSYSPKLHLLKTRYLLEHDKLQFDKVIVFVDVSDAQDELFYESFVPAAAAALPVRLARAFSRRSATAHFAGRLLAPERRVDNAFTRPPPGEHDWIERERMRRVTSDQPQSDKQDRWKWTLRDDLFDAWGRRGLELAGGHVRELAALCRKRGIDLAIVVYPSPHQIFAGDLDSRQVRFWRQLAREEGLPFVDLFPAFIDLDAARPAEAYEWYFIPGDLHWNPAGHRRAALAVAEALDGFVSDQSAGDSADARRGSSARIASTRAAIARPR